MRVKIISKGSHPKFYGRVGTLTAVDRDGYCSVCFDDGVVKKFRRDELRLGVKAFG